MKTITGREFTITSNKSKRTFTIRTSEGLKFRTYPMSKTDFENTKHNTANDWQSFLNYSSDYFQVK